MGDGGDRAEMESGCPYLFIVGAGISAPEILTANGIIDQCKKKVEQLCQGDEEKLQRICDTAERLGEIARNIILIGLSRHTKIKFTGSSI